MGGTEKRGKVEEIAIGGPGPSFASVNGFTHVQNYLVDRRGLGPYINDVSRVRGEGIADF